MMMAPSRSSVGPLTARVAANLGPDAMPTWARNTVSPKFRSTRFADSGSVQTIPVRLPKVPFEPTSSKPENVVLSVKAAANGACEVYWGQTQVHAQELLDRSVAKLKKEIDKQGGPNAPGLELPEVHIRADIDTPWRCVGGAMTNVARAGFTKVGFISQPDPGMYHAAVD